MTRLIMLFISVSLLAFATPVQGAAGADTDPRMKQALERVDKRTWTTADLAYIKTDRTLAAQVADPRASATDRGATSGRTTNSSARALGSCGHYYKAWYRKRSLLGSTIYKYHHKVVYCQTRTRITRWQSRSDFLTEADSVVYWRGLINNQRYGIGSGRAYSKRQRAIELCVVKYGCYQRFHPWVGITLRAAGRDTYRGSGG